MSTPHITCTTASRAEPGLFFSRRRVLAVSLACALAACAPKLNWRELKLPQAQCVIALPDKPQTEERDLLLDGERVTMSMTSTGVGPSLFALGVAQLPARALAPERLEATVAFFRDGLLRNVQGTLTATATVKLSAPAGRVVRVAQSVTASGRIGRERNATLAARFYVVDDRLYQLVALGAEDEIPAAALETFFDSFRLTS